MTNLKLSLYESYLSEHKLDRDALREFSTQLPPLGMVIDVGAGAGRLKEFYKGTLNDRKVLALEPDKVGYKLLQRATKELANVETENKSIQNFSKNSQEVAGLIFAYCALAEISPISFTLTKAFQILKPGGIIYIGLINPSKFRNSQPAINIKAQNDTRNASYSIKTFKVPFLGENEFVTKYECLSPDPNLKESIIIRQNFPDPDDLIDLAKELGFECINDSRKTPKGENDFYFHLTLKKLEEKNKSTPIKDYYDKAAPEYSQTLEKFRYKVPSELPALIAEDWSNTNPKVLDLGCGNGWLAQTLTQLKISPSQLHGVDLSINMLKEAKNNFNFNATLQWDLNNKLSPFLEGSQYELVFLLGTSEFLDSLEQWIINTYSLLTLGGDFIFTVEDVNKKTIDAISQGKSYKTKRQYSKDDVLALLKKHHFDILDSIAIPSSYYSPGLNNEAVNYHLFRARKNQ